MADREDQKVMYHNLKFYTYIHTSLPCQITKMVEDMQFLPLLILVSHQFIYLSTVLHKNVSSQSTYILQVK